MKMENLNHMGGPKHNIDKMISEVLTNFNFHRVYLTMKALNWTWFPEDEPPHIQRMKETAEYLLRKSVEGSLECKNLSPNEPYFSATGGFKAYCYRSKHKHVLSLHLEFIVSEWESDGDS